MELPNYSLYAISFSVETLKKAIDDGCLIVQLRDKSNDLDSIYSKARQLVSYKKIKDFVCIINDFPQIAVDTGADGVHIGQDTNTLETRKIVKNLIIGKSTHSLGQGLSAQEEKVDYISVGPVFETPTKPGRPAVGLEYVREASKAIQVPFVAIGGIDLNNINDVLKAGAKIIGVVRAVNDAPALLERIKKQKR